MLGRCEALLGRCEGLLGRRTQPQWPWERGGASSTAGWLAKSGCRSLTCRCGAHQRRSARLSSGAAGGELRAMLLIPAPQEVLRDGMSDGKVVAVGETGLDYDR